MRFAEGKKRPSAAVIRFATQRLSIDGHGRVVYRYKQPFRDGSTHVLLEPLDFMARLAARADRHAGKASCTSCSATGLVDFSPRRISQFIERSRSHAAEDGTKRPSADATLATRTAPYQKYEPVPGVGDAAFFTANSAYANLYVWTGAHHFHIEVGVGFMDSDDTEALKPNSVELAKAIVARLP